MAAIRGFARSIFRHAGVRFSRVLSLREMVLSLRETRPPGRYTKLVPGAAGNSLATRWRPTGTPAQRPQPSNVCHASRSYSWISSPRTSWRRIRTVARSATEAVAMPPRLAALPSRRERDRDPQLLPIGASVYCCFPRCFPAPRWIALPSGGQRRGCAGTPACTGESRPAPARSRTRSEPGQKGSSISSR